jgi:hypothetical protein
MYMEREPILGRMDQYIQDNGKMEKGMAREQVLLLMVLNI